jgi:hypothetical protein
LLEAPELADAVRSYQGHHVEQYRLLQAELAAEALAAAPEAGGGADDAAPRLLSLDSYMRRAALMVRLRVRWPRAALRAPLLRALPHAPQR